MCWEAPPQAEVKKHIHVSFLSGIAVVRIACKIAFILITAFPDKAESEIGIYVKNQRNPYRFEGVSLWKRPFSIPLCGHFFGAQAALKR
jgi:hypothetical protein